MAEGAGGGAGHQRGLEGAALGGHAVGGGGGQRPKDGAGGGDGVDEGGGGGHDSSDHGGGGGEERGGHGGHHGVHEAVLVHVLGEALEVGGAEAAGGLDQVAEGGGEGPGHQLRVSLGLALVQPVHGLVAGAGQGTGVARGIVGAVVVGGVPSVAVGGVVVQRVGFRLSQAERGYGENYDHALHV